MASSLVRNRGWDEESRSTRPTTPPARNAPRMLSSPNRSASATNAKRSTTAARTRISAVVSCNRVSTSPRRWERPASDTTAPAATTNPANSISSTTLLAVLPSEVENRQLGQRRADHPLHLAGQHRALRGRPGLRELPPVPGILTVGALEPAGIEGRPGVEIRPRHRALLPHTTVLRGVHQDPVDPGLQRRPALEPVNSRSTASQASCTTSSAESWVD